MSNSFRETFQLTHRVGAACREISTIESLILENEYVALKEQYIV